MTMTEGWIIGLRRGDKVTHTRDQSDKKLDIQTGLSVEILSVGCIVLFPAVTYV